MKSFIGLLIVLFSIGATASKFKGYVRKPNTEPLILTESVDRVVETQTQIMVLLKKHAAFFKFPKSHEYAGQVRDFLNQRKKSDRKITLTVDPITAEILYIEDAEQK